MQDLFHARPQDGGYGHKQQQGIDQRDEDRHPLVTVGVFLRRLDAHHPVSQQSQQQRKDVAEVVPGVREQCQRPEPQTGSCFYQHKGQVEYDPEDKIPARRLVVGQGRMMVVMFVCHKKRK